MKKYLITLTMLLALGAGSVTAQTAPQAQTELADTVSQDQLEAYSDTMQVAGDSTTVSSGHRIGGLGDYSEREDTALDHFMGGLFSEAMETVLVVLIVCFLTPIFVLGLLLYFIFKNRHERMKLAQMAIQQGQPIPQELLGDKGAANEDTYQSGIKQLFLGIGLMIFLSYMIDEVGFGIGALVFCMGLGKIVIARTSGKGKGDSEEQTDINPTNIDKL